MKMIFLAKNNVQTGDLTEREDIKRRLKCKSFRWYLENVYPESNMRNEFIYLGEVSNRSVLNFPVHRCTIAPKNLNSKFRLG